MLILMFHILALLLILNGVSDSKPELMVLGIAMEATFLVATLYSRWQAKWRRRPELENS